MNKFIGLGRLTKDVELRYSTNGNNTAVASFTVAIDRRFQKQGEEKKADFIPCKAFGKTAEFVSKYFNKGSMIAVVGEMQTRTWDDAEGKRHYGTDIMVNEVHFAGSKSNGNPDSEPSGSNGNGFYPLEDGDLPF